jgi:hypothetical protein
MKFNDEEFEDDGHQQTAQRTVPNAYQVADNSSDTPKPEQPKRGDGENDRPHPQQPYHEGDDEQANVPGPNELPDQQKVGEDDEIEHIET